MEQEKYIGVVEDPRSELEKSFDFKHDELGEAAPVVWNEKTEFKSYLIKNQDGSSSCVSQAVSKMLGILQPEYVNLSPKFIYTRRANYPDGGMYLPDALNIARKQGSCLETSLPSDFTPESFMNDKAQETPNCVTEALKYKQQGYVSLNDPHDIDAIAAVLSKGLPVLLGVRFDYDEWTETPTVNPNSKNTCGHGIVATDFGLINGVKTIAIDDSWGVHYGRGGQRFITEEFLKAKCFYAGYLLPLVKEQQDTTGFHYKWTEYMQFNNPKNNKTDVYALQSALQKLGLFPANLKATGWYGAITRKAVYDFQVKYVGTHNKGVQVGVKTLAKLNEMFK